MKNKQGVSHTVIFSWAVMLGLSLFMLFTATTVQAQTNPVPTPDPTVQVLENSVERQTQDIELLNERLVITNEKLETRFWIATAAAVLFGIVGSVGFIQMERGHRKKIEDLEEKFQKKEEELWKKFGKQMQTKFEQELYGLDATMLTVRIREGKHKDKLARRLELSGFKNVQVYREFGKHMLSGITVIPVSNKEDEVVFNLFIEEYGEKLNPTRAAFVLYTVDNYRVASQTLDAFDNLSLANTPTSLATNILAVGRGLMP